MATEVVQNRLHSSKAFRDIRALSKITISGFASHRIPHSIDIRPLTILAGSNSAGKSSSIKPLLLLKQTLDSTTDPGPLLISGPNVKFTSLGQMFTRISRQESMKTFEVALKMSLGSFDLELELGFSRESKAKLDISKAKYEHDIWHTNSKVQLALYPDIPSHKIKAQIPKREIESAEEIAKRYADVMGTVFPKALQDAAGTMLLDSDTVSRPQDLLWGVRRQRCFLGVSLSSFGTDHYLFNPAFHPNCNFATAITKVIHVPAFRRRIARHHSAIDVGSEFPGTFEDYTAAVVAKWEADGDKRLANLTRSLQEVGLTSGVSTHKLNDAEIELRVARPGRENPAGRPEMLSLADVGVGVSYVLPVLVALEVAEPSQTVYVEQPESHLHPRAAYGLAKALARAANRGVRVIVETHSSLLLLHVQTLVSRGELEPESVGLHWFSLDEDGFSKIDFVQPDEHGRVGEWPEDFADVELSAHSEYLQSVRT